MKRENIRKSVRFEVFKRDSFSCQYCGRSAPDVILHVDHINPVSKGGDNGILNLITSCVECNSGKGARPLSDNSALKKQLGQLKDLQERKEQIELMARWRKEMTSVDDLKVAALVDAINQEFAPAERVLSEHGEREIRNWLKKYSLAELFEALDASSSQYLKDPKEQEDRNMFLDKIPRIAYWKRREKESPEEAKILRSVAIAQSRWFRCNRQMLYREIKDRLRNGWSIEDIDDAIFASSGIIKFQDLLNGAGE